MEKFIQKALNPKSKGKLHKALKVPMEKKIPVAKLKSAATKGGKIGKRANLALTLRSFQRGK